MEIPRCFQVLSVVGGEGGVSKPASRIFRPDIYGSSARPRRPPLGLEDFQVARAGGRWSLS